MKHKIFIMIGILLHILILTQSLLPADLSSEQSGFIVDVLHPFVSSLGIQIEVDTFSFLVRKAAHFTEFVLLGLVWFYVYAKYFNKLKLIGVVLLHGLLTGILDETIQLFVDGRSGQLTDVLIDFSGVVCACLVMYYITKKHPPYTMDKVDKNLN